MPIIMSRRAEKSKYTQTTSKVGVSAALKHDNLSIGRSMHFESFCPRSQPTFEVVLDYRIIFLFH